MSIVEDWETIPLMAFNKNAKGQRPMVSYFEVLDFIEKVEALREKQIREATKHIPAIFKKGEE